MALVERVAIVTGSSTGIGRAVAVELAKEGFHVAVNYSRSQTEAHMTAAAIKSVGADCVVVGADVSSDEDCRRLVAEAVRRWGRVDALVNNAGVTKPTPLVDLDAISASDWDRIFDVNVKGAFFMARACAAQLREARGCIVNISSTAGITSIGSSIPYAASKASLNNLTLALARALAPEVRVNAILPGYVETGWNERVYGQRLPALRNVVKGRTLLGDVATPEHIAQLVSSTILRMSWVTGQLIVVDGGQLVGK